MANEADQVNFPQLPEAKLFKTWWTDSKEAVAAASGHPDQAYEWWTAVEYAENMSELSDTEGFDRLSMKTCSALTCLAFGEIKRKIKLIRERRSKLGKMLRGRKVAFLIREEYKLSIAEGALYSFSDLMNVKPWGNSIRDLIAYFWDWEGKIDCVANEVELDKLGLLEDRHKENFGHFPMFCQDP